MNILITGGAGFIGSNLIERLIQNGNNILALDIKKEPKNLNEILGSFEYINGDIRNKKLLNDIFHENRIDGIVHLAAVSRVVWGHEDPNLCFDVNTNGTRILFETLKKSYQKPWIIFGSSREVYGEPIKLPVCEEFRKIPINVYGETKITGENIVHEYSRELGLKSVILRFSNVYGDQKDILDRVLPRFILRALKGENVEIHGGNQLIDFTHIRDTITGILKTINYLEDCEESITEDFHLLPGTGTSLQDAVDIITNQLEEPPEIIITKPRTYDVDRFVGDPTKARKLLDFKAEILPQQGIPTTIDCYREAFDL